MIWLLYSLWCLWRPEHLYGNSQTVGVASARSSHEGAKGAGWRVAASQMTSVRPRKVKKGFCSTPRVHSASRVKFDNSHVTHQIYSLNPVLSEFQQAALCLAFIDILFIAYLKIHSLVVRHFN